MKKNLILIAFCSIALLASCGEDDSDNNSNNSEIVGVEGILLNLKTTNIDDVGFPWYNSQNITGDDFVRLKSWNVSQDNLIPVKTNGFSLAEQALDLIEQEIGVVFLIEPA